ncbi:amidohydrolase family protein [Gryllotalpicola daejeonensis]|uniref:amidohydrolase family protein n=1 Tax=Gryllotalpicola daejeonensis TaxID=993087 RepID=UPI0031CEB56B
MTIDTHVHLWDPADGYAWLANVDPLLRRHIGAADAHVELAAAGVEEAILVQADDTASDTDRMLAAAAAHDWIVGVVGWVPLDDEVAAAAELERRVEEPKLRGIRHLVHDDPRDDFLELPAVRASLARVAAHGLAFDVPDAWPRHLARAADLAAALPELTVVIDHLAKPPFGGPDWNAWATEFARAAAQPNTVAKVSGLHAAGFAHPVETVRPAWDLALEVFGPDRLMYGSDWPMTAAGSGYGSTRQQLGALIGELSPAEQRAVYETTARRVYALPPLAPEHAEPARRTSRNDVPTAKEI